MVTTDTIEGIIDGVLSYHYDVTNDVLYLRLLSDEATESLSEETADGLLLLRSADTDEPVGLTIVNWWQRFGRGALPDSLHELNALIEPWAQRLAA